jgi:hypothetical protein
MMSLKPCVLLFGTISLFAFHLSAQTISGKATDALSKAPIVNAKVMVLELKKEIATDSAGFFKFDSLDKGNYSVRIEADKYLRQTKSVILASPKGEAGATNISLGIVLFSISSNADQSTGQLSIKYFFPGHADAEINVCDSLGKVVRTVYDRSHTSGMRTFLWNGDDNKGKVVLPGKYACKIKCGNFFTLRTLVWTGEEKEIKPPD